MDFRKTEEQELMLESMDEFLAGCGFDDNYFKEKYAKSENPVEFFRACKDAGFSLLGIPEEYGGTDVDLLTRVMLAERMLTKGYPSCMGTALQVEDMLIFGNEEQKKIVFDHMMENGTLCFGLGFTEPQAGSDSAAMTTSATHKDGKVIINGHKSFTSSALEVPYILVSAKETDVEGNPVSLYFIPTNAPGVKISDMHKIGCRTGSLCEVYLEEVCLPETALVGKMGNGFVQMMKNFEIERLLIAASCLGIAQCAFNDAAAYANQRVQFGKPIGTFQLIQQKITQSYIKLENMRNMIYKTAWMKDNGESIRIASGTTKLYCAQAAFEVVDDCLQIMGGIGYTEEHRISRLWRDIRMHRIGGGTDEIMIHSTSRQILKQYK